jgi:hypothetical protein
MGIGALYMGRRMATQVRFWRSWIAKSKQALEAAAERNVSSWK